MFDWLLNPWRRKPPSTPGMYEARLSVMYTTGEPLLLTRVCVLPGGFYTIGPDNQIKHELVHLRTDLEWRRA